ncbi:unnamed protein product [Bemisia tabaci]|uniref:Methyltransferase type 11 domain-containing protein n=1 Tax=Bemisia tabaci TaxID=7038 RepID=A0A9P0AE42_BEMTA|nr:unnamed protein product [Bemisia tabaci]
MANLFLKQVVEYAKGRPTYPAELFCFIAEKTPEHELAWDVGTGSGQAAQSLAEYYEKIVATDTSPKQLELAPKLPNVRYEQTPPTMSKEELRQKIAAESSVDLVTVAQAIHWFDLSAFYEQARWVLKKPHGVVAAWCYTTPKVNSAVDAVLPRFYRNPFWRPEFKTVGSAYADLEFPFQPLDELHGTGPIRFENVRTMSLDDYFVYLRSWSSYQDAKDQGVELLDREMIEDFTRAWISDGISGPKSVNFPVYLRIGTVGASGEA